MAENPVDLRHLFRLELGPETFQIGASLLEKRIGDEAEFSGGPQEDRQFLRFELLQSLSGAAACEMDETLQILRVFDGRLGQGPGHVGEFLGAELVVAFHARGEVIGNLK